MDDVSLALSDLISLSLAHVENCRHHHDVGSSHVAINYMLENLRN